MTEATDPAGEPAPPTVGARLRAARLAQHLDLDDIAGRTRIPLRHLRAIEDGDYSQMPTPTYAVGFAKAYARAVGEDEVAIAREVRGQSELTTKRTEYTPFETDEPARTPSGAVTIVATLVALLLLIGAGLYFGTTLFRGDGLSNATPVPAASPASDFVPGGAASPVAPAAGGQVTLVANDEVWLRVYDAAGKSLFEKTLSAGERYDVPADADGPMINVGRPDKLQVLVNGAAVAQLGDGRIAIKDVGISAAALAARGVPAPSASATTSTDRSSTGSSSGSGTGSGGRDTGSSRSVPAAFRSPGATATRRPSAAPTDAETPRPAATPTARATSPVAPAPATAAPGNTL